MRNTQKLVVAFMLIMGLAASVTAQGPCATSGPGSSGCQCDSNYLSTGVICHQCRITNEMVPVKKSVYETKCVPVCELHPGRICDCGPTCKFHYKKVLVKKEVVVGYKCVPKCSVQ